MKFKLPRNISVTPYCIKLRRFETFKFAKGIEVDKISERELNALYPFRNSNLVIDKWQLIIKKKKSVAVWLPIIGERISYFVEV